MVRAHTRVGGRASPATRAAIAMRATGGLGKSPAAGGDAGGLGQICCNADGGDRWGPV